MALILTSRTPWRQRPSGIVVPHVGSQAYDGLVGWWYWDGALARDGLTSAGFAPTGTSSSGVDPHVGPYLNTASDAYVATTLLGPSGTPGLSVSAWVLVPSIANNATIIGARGNGWKFGVNGASAGDPLRLTFFGVADQDSSASGIAANTWTHVAVTYNKVSVRFFLNGQLISSHARTTAIGDTSIYPFFLSAYNNNGTPAENAGCRFVDVRYYQRGRSDDEVWADYDPATRWSLYAPVVRRVYVEIVGGSGPSNMTCDAGSYTLTGNAATLTKASALAPDAGSYTVAGNTTTLTVARILTCDAGSYTLTGNAVTLTKASVLLPAAGAYTLTGNDAALTYQQAGSLTCDVGTYTVTGFDTTLTVARLLTANTGDYTTTGLDVTFTVGTTLICDSGNYTVTGFDPTLLYIRSLSATTGAYTVTGQAVTLLYSGAPVEDTDYSEYIFGQGSDPISTLSIDLLPNDDGVSSLSISLGD